MNLHSYREQHIEILAQVDELRGYVHAGIPENAGCIVEALREMSESIRRHLASEDFLLYPSLRRAADPRIVAMGQAYQAEMGDLSGAFRAFVVRWSTAEAVIADPEGFRQQANDVFRALFERIRREDEELYPAAMRAD